MSTNDASDRERLARMVHTHRRALVRYGLRRLDSPADFEDLVAETFVVAWRRLHTAPAESQELPWLYAIARRVVANMTRGRSRSLRLEARLAIERELVEDEPRFSDYELGALVRSLGQLRADERELLELAYWERLRYRDLAAVVGCSEKAVSVRLTRAKQRLREGLVAQLHARPGHE